MPLEDTDTIAGLNENWPLGSDPVGRGASHIRLIKKVLKNSSVATQAEYNTLDALVAATGLVVGQLVGCAGRKNIFDGGGARYSVVAAGTGTVDGGQYINATASGLQLQLINNEDYINLKRFGGIADNGLTDNRLAIQNMTDYAVSTGKLIVIDDVPEGSYFGINSLHPDYADGYAWVITDIRNVTIYGNRKRNTSVRYTGAASGRAFLKLLNESDPTAQEWGLQLLNCGFAAWEDEDDIANFKLDYVIDAWTQRQFAQCLFVDGTWAAAKKAGFKGAIYLSKFLRVEARYINDGTANEGFSAGFDILNEEGQSETGGTTTSLHFDNCWARFCKNYGYRVRNQLWYSSFNATACDSGYGTTPNADRTDWAYYFGNIRGVAFNGIGAEGVNQVFRCASTRGSTLNSMMGTSNGPRDGSTLESPIQIGGGHDFTIAGVTTNIFDETQYDWDLKIQQPSEGREFIHVLDGCINPNRTLIDTSGQAPTFFRRYPEIVRFSAGLANDRGYFRTGNVVTPGDDSVPLVPTTMGDGPTYDTTPVQRQTIVSNKLYIPPNSNAITRVNILKTFNGTSDSMVTVRLKFGKLNAATNTWAIWEGVATISGPNGKQTFFEQVAGTSGVTCALTWVGSDKLEVLYNSNFGALEIEYSFMSESGIGVETLREVF